MSPTYGTFVGTVRGFSPCTLCTLKEFNWECASGLAVPAGPVAFLERAWEFLVLFLRSELVGLAAMPWFGVALAADCFGEFSGSGSCRTWVGGRPVSGLIPSLCLSSWSEVPLKRILVAFFCQWCLVCAFGVLIKGRSLIISVSLIRFSFSWFL